MKADPEELKEIAIHMDQCLRQYPDTMRYNPDIADSLRHLRDKVRALYDHVKEGRRHCP